MSYVIQPVVQPEQAPRDDDSSSRPTLVSDDAAASADDSGQGLALFVLFTVAVLVVTGAVGFLALFTSWWVLGIIFGVHVLLTVVVGTAVFSVLSSGKPSVEGDNLMQLGVATSREGPVQPGARSGKTSRIAA